MNPTSLSIELKFDLCSARSDLPLRSPAKYLGTVHERDVYYDVAGRFDLLRSGCFLRVRNNSALEFKFDGSQPTSHEYCYETTFGLPLCRQDLTPLSQTLSRCGLRAAADLNSIDEILEKNDLSVLVVISKVREIFKLHEFKICRDAVEDLGQFLEIEFDTSDLNCDVKAVTRRMQEMISDPDLPIVRTGYVELLLARARPELLSSGVLSPTSHGL